MGISRAALGSLSLGHRGQVERVSIRGEHLSASVPIRSFFSALMFISLCLLTSVTAGSETANRGPDNNFGQDTANHSDERTQSGKAGHISTKVVSISGRVSSDRKTFVSDKGDKTWTVINPDRLKGYEGHRVKAKARADTTQQEIFVISVKERPTYNPIPEQP